MALVRMRTRPFDLVNGNLLQDFDRFFNEVASPAFQNGAQGYQADLYETEDQLVLEMAVPGLKAEDLEISVEDHQLVVKGKVSEEKTEGEDRRYWMQSISRSEFSRSLKLPKTVNLDAIEATVVNGILKVSMPKMAEAKVKKIEISNS